ncbi:hypothetical protein Patl1_06480 [Pistacia atlantica]|uniref:Uncharacterized protein n=1 Tax=Pistacia atlantica TaxID=434234 RepID=A0ACC1BVE5_9ROSI|nr:hypothetical protein Patl1_06480 [Pistacia atlantica]
MLPYEPSSTRVQAGDEELRNKELINKLVQENLKEAQAKMKLYADRKRADKEFQVGDKVYLRLHPYQQISVVMRRNLKLSPRYYGTYMVIVGEHIRPFTELPEVTTEATLEPEPEMILNRRMIKKGQRARVEMLV